ncbi:MAG: hypothetical protein ABMB14_22075 [Myxococcota bacterium]
MTREASADSSDSTSDEFQGFAIEEYDSWSCSGNFKPDLGYSFDTAWAIQDVLDGWTTWETTDVNTASAVSPDRWTDASFGGNDTNSDGGADASDVAYFYGHGSYDPDSGDEGSYIYVRTAATGDYRSGGDPQPADAGQLAAAQDAALDWLVGLGFDEREFGSVVAAQIASDSADDLNPVWVRSYHDLKTFVDRSIGGGLVGGERLVVTHDTAGALVRATGRWTPVAPDVAVYDLAPPLSNSEAAAALAVPETWIVSVRAVFVIDGWTDAGEVASGRVLREIAWRDPDADGEKIRSTYLADGLVVESDDALPTPVPPEEVR